MAEDRTSPSKQTIAADEAEAAARHEADRAPTPEEERAAEEGSSKVDMEETSAHYEEMAERGANQKGEGRI
jgi:hypothetical protein